MTAFHFLRPEWLWGLPAALLLLVWLARRQLRSRSWQAVCDPELLPHLLLGRSVRRANWPLWLLLLGLLLALVALAGPAWERQAQPLFRQQSALVIMYDLSRSMLAADLKPNRLVRARLKLEDLLRQRKEGQTALIAFAADAFTVTPLTSDRHTIEALLKSLTPELMPAQGSDPARAIRLGMQLLQQAGLKHGRLLMVSDEDQPETTMAAARQLASQGYDLAVLGVGTAEGAPIPQAGGGFFKDAQGSLVLPRLNTAGLERLAAAGGGSYHAISIDDSDLHSLLAGLDDHHLGQLGSSTSATGDLWREEGVWLLWPLALLAAFAFRRGWLLVLPLLLFWPAPARALNWPELWRTPDQQAARAFAEQDFAGAAAKFQNPRWKASALYRAGRYADAAKLLDESQTADDYYNQGNALARQGDLPGALQAYQQALQKNSAHADARYNQELVEKELQKQQEQPDQQQPQGNKDQGDQQQKNSGEQGSPQQSAEKNQQQSQQGDQSPPPQQNQSAQADQDDQGAQDSSAARDKNQQQGQSPPKSAAAQPADDTSPAAAQPAQPQQQQPAAEPPETPPASAAQSADQPPETAEQRESRLLLQQIPDDPGGLLRRKFLFQYRQRGQQGETDRSW
jgi:Ca-activated chloride channel homolog